MVWLANPSCMLLVRKRGNRWSSAGDKCSGKARNVRERTKWTRSPRNLGRKVAPQTPGLLTRDLVDFLERGKAFRAARYSQIFTHKTSHVWSFSIVLGKALALKTRQELRRDQNPQNQAKKALASKKLQVPSPQQRAL